MEVLFEALFDLRVLHVRIAEFFEVVMTMARRKRMTNREFWEKFGARFVETDRKLLERIEYHRQRADAEEQTASRQQASH